MAGIAVAVAVAFFILWRRARRDQALPQGTGVGWNQEEGVQQQQVYAHYGSQPANYYRAPEEMGAHPMRTPELAGEEAGAGLKSDG